MNNYTEVNIYNEIISHFYSLTKGITKINKKIVINLELII